MLYLHTVSQYEILYQNVVCMFLGSHVRCMFTHLLHLIILTLLGENNKLGITSCNFFQSLVSSSLLTDSVHINTGLKHLQSLFSDWNQISYPYKTLGTMRGLCILIFSCEVLNVSVLLYSNTRLSTSCRKLVKWGANLGRDYADQGYAC